MAQLDRPMVCDAAGHCWTSPSDEPAPWTFCNCGLAVWEGHGDAPTRACCQFDVVVNGDRKVFRRSTLPPEC